ncbi:MAG TPA: ferredoxin [Gaiellales bacterium]|jgi:ferredoxin
MSCTIIIDRNVCSGFGACVDAAPDIFAIGVDGIATGPPQTDDRDAALRAALECPMGAITVLEDDGGEAR